MSLGCPSCPLGVPNVLQMSLSAIVCPGNAIVGVHGKQNMVTKQVWLEF